MSGYNRIVCAWCGKIVKDGPDVITHTICKPCDLRQRLEMVMETMKVSCEEIEETVDRIRHDKEVEWRRQATQ